MPEDGRAPEGELHHWSGLGRERPQPEARRAALALFMWRKCRCVGAIMKRLGRLAISLDSFVEWLRDAPDAGAGLSHAGGSLREQPSGASDPRAGCGASAGAGQRVARRDRAAPGADPLSARGGSPGGRAFRKRRGTFARPLAGGDFRCGHGVAAPAELSICFTTGIGPFTPWFSRRANCAQTRRWRRLVRARSRTIRKRKKCLEHCFWRQFPGSANRLAEAKLALAELAFLAAQEGSFAGLRSSPRRRNICRLRITPRRKMRRRRRMRNIWRSFWPMRNSRETTGKRSNWRWPFCAATAIRRSARK